MLPAPPHGRGCLEVPRPLTPHVYAAIFLRLAVISLEHRPQDASDIAALRDAEARIQAEVERLAEMRKKVETIHRSANDAGEQLRKGNDQLAVFLPKAQTTLTAFNMSGAVLPAPSLEKARSGLAAQWRPRNRRHDVRPW